MIDIRCGDCRDLLRDIPEKSVHCVITSPPYYALRDYEVDGQIGLEATLTEYITKLVDVFREVRRVMRPDATAWINMGDCYDAGTRASRDVSRTSKHGYWNNPAINLRPKLGIGPKQLAGIPWRLALALQDDGWILRADVIWAKPNPMPESVTDRPTKSHEYLFLFAKSPRYFYDADAVRESAVCQDPRRGKIMGRGLGGFAKVRGCDRNSSGGFPRDGLSRNRRTVWTIPTKPFKGAHFATFPEALIEPCVLAGCPKDGTVLDPFAGAGTVGLVARRHNRHALLLELNPGYCTLMRERLGQGLFCLGEIAA